MVDRLIFIKHTQQNVYIYINENMGCKVIDYISK